MPTFTPGIAVVTDKPVVAVDPGLKPGRYRFRLEVVDAAGNQSMPAELTITVLRRAIVTPPPVIRSTPVLTPLPVPVIVGKKGRKKRS